MTQLISLALLSVNGVRAMGVRGGRLLALIFVAWMWLLTWTNTSNPDSDGYRYFYYADGIRTQGVGPGYWALIAASRSLGLEYPSFQAITSGFSLLLIWRTTMRYTSRVNFVFALYFLLPFFYDAIQVRNTLSYSIVLYGFHYMTGTRSRDLLKYMALVGVASTIHLAAVLYVIFPLTLSDRFRALRVSIVALGVVLSAAMLTDPTLAQWLGTLVVDASGADRLSTYFDTQTGLGFLAFLSLHLMGLGVLWAACKAYDPVTEFDAHGRNRRFTTILLRSSTMLLILAPLYLLNSNFWRPMRNLQPLYYIAFVMALDLCRASGRDSKLLKVLFWTYFVAMLGIVLIPSFNKVTLPILLNTSLFPPPP